MPVSFAATPGPGRSRTHQLRFSVSGKSAEALDALKSLPRSILYTPGIVATCVRLAETSEDDGSAAAALDILNSAIGHWREVKTATGAEYLLQLLLGKAGLFLQQRVKGISGADAAAAAKEAVDVTHSDPQKAKVATAVYLQTLYVGHNVDIYVPHLPQSASGLSQMLLKLRPN